MRNINNMLLCSLCVLVISACAGEAPRERPPELGGQEIWEMLGCAEDEIAICVAVHCAADDWVCADRDSLRDLFRPRRNN